MRVILDFAKRRFRKKKKKRKGRKETRNFKSYRRIALMKINSLEPIPGNVSNIVSKLALSAFGREEGKEERKKERKKKRMKKEKKLESFGRHVPRKSR